MNKARASVPGTPPGAGGGMDALAPRVAAVLRRGTGSGLALADQAVLSAANFVGIYLLARFMDARGFGVLMLAQTALLLATGLHNAIIVEPQSVLASGLDRRAFGEFLAAMLPVQRAVSAVLTALCLVVALSIVALDGGRGLAVALVLPAVLAAVLAQEFVRRSLYTRSQAGRALVNDSVCALLQLGGIIALVATAQAGPAAVLAVMGTAALAAAALGQWRLRRCYPAAPGAGRRARPEAVRRTWRLGKWLLGRSAVTWLGVNGHVWLIAALLGTEALGVYRAALHLVNVINPLRMAAAAYLTPRGGRLYQRRGVAALCTWTRRTSRFLALGLAPFALLLAGFPDHVLHLAYGAKYAHQGLGPVLALGTLAQLIYFLKFPWDTALLVTGRAKTLFMIGLLPVALLASLGVAALTRWGLQGMALLSVLIAVAAWAATFAAYRRRVADRRATLGMEVQG